MKPRYQSQDNTEEIKAGIEETRARMDGTLDELSERLTPRHLLDDVLDYFQSRRERGAHDSQHIKKAASAARDSAADAGHAILRQVKRNPVPALLVGAGIAWWLLENSEEENQQEGYADLYSDEAADLYYERQGGHPDTPELLEGDEGQDKGSDGGGMMHNIKEKSSHLKEQGSQKMRRMSQAMHDRTDRIRAKAHEKREQWRDQGSEMYDRGIEKFKTTADEHPLATAAGFLALGMVAGLLLPSTRKENELVGPTRDRLVQRSTEAAHGVMEQGKQVVASVAHAAKVQAKEQGLTPEKLKESGARVLESVKETARQEGLTPSAMKEKAKVVVSESKHTALEESGSHKGNGGHGPV